MHLSKMSIVVFVAAMVAVANAATIKDPADCETFPCTIFEDNFDYFDHYAWEHEITMGGGGNWEFQLYGNNRSTSFVTNGSLFIKPQLLSDKTGEELLTSGTYELWGSTGRNDVCTSNAYYGCRRDGTPTNLINPIASARLRTQQNFGFKYGRMTIRAKMPRGDWLWPAIWLLPTNWQYGHWPASGEIDIVETIGNVNGNDSIYKSAKYAGSTLHWGPYFEENQYLLTRSDYGTSDTGDFTDDFHTWELTWTNESIIVNLDSVEQLRVEIGDGSFWTMAGFDDRVDIDNPWENDERMAPFDQRYYIVLNVAVGGTNGFFPEEIPGKPWKNTSPTAFRDFYEDKANWLPTWGDDGTGRPGAAMEVDFVKVEKLTSAEM